MNKHNNNIIEANNQDKPKKILDRLKKITDVFGKIQKDTAWKIAMAVSLLGGTAASANTNSPDNNSTNTPTKTTKEKKVIPIKTRNFEEVKNTGYKGINEELKDDINLNSFNNTFSKILENNDGNASQIIEKLNKNPNSEEYQDITNSITGENKNLEENEKYERTRDLFIKNGYSAKNKWLTSTEGNAIYNQIENYLENSKKIEGIIDNNGRIIDFNDFKNYLFDFDYDGDIENEKILGVSETQIKFLVNETNYENLIKSLNLIEDGEAIKDFNKKIKTSPKMKFLFHEKLIEAISLTGNIESLLIDKSEEQVKETIVLKLEIQKQIESKITKEKIEEKLSKKFPEETQKIKSKLGKDKWDEILDNFTTSGQAFSLGIVQGAGTSFDISKITNGLLDNINIGAANTPLGIIYTLGVSKNLFDIPLSENGNTKISSVAGVNLNSYFINLSLTHQNTEDLKTIFQEVKKGGFSDNFEISGNVNYINIAGVGNIISVGANIEELDQESYKGAEKMITQMDPIVDNTLKKISEGTSAEDLKIKDLSENFTKEEETQIKEKYEEIKKTYDKYSKKLNDEQKKLFKDDFKKVILKNYSNRLHKNTEGFNFTGGGFGVAFLSGYYPIPYIMLKGEYNYSEITENKNNIKEITNKKIQSKNQKEVKENLKVQDQIGFKKNCEYRGKNVLVVNKIEGVNISADKNSGIQAEEENGNIYISTSSNKIPKIRINRQTVNNAAQFTIIFGKGNIDSNNKIIPGGYSNEITSGLPEKEVIKTKSETIKMSDAIDEFEGIKDLVKNMSHKMDKRYTEKIYEITKDFRTNQYKEENINKSWNKFLTSLEKKGKLNRFGNFKSKIKKIETIKQKKIILESLIHNVRSDINLKWKQDNKIHSYYAGKEISVKKYDTMRQAGKAKPRSEAFSEQLSDDLGIDKEIIDKYNSKFYTNLKEGQSSFNVNYYTNGDIISFIGTGKKEKIFPATNVVRYADIDGNGNFEEGKDYLELENQKITLEMINLIPDEILNKYLEKLKKSEKLKENQKNLNFIKSLILGDETIDGINVKYKIIQSKWGDCFNTMIAIKGLEINLAGSESSTSKEIKTEEYSKTTTYKQNDKTIGLAALYTGELEKKKDKKPEQKINQEDDTPPDNTTEPNTTNPDETSFTNESETVNEDPNKGTTIKDSIDNGVKQTPEVTTETVVTQDVIDDSVGDTITTPPQKIQNPNIDTGLKVGDDVLQGTDNSISNIKNPSTQATKISTGDNASNSDF